MDKKTILIVDDTFENLYLLRVILEEAGHGVVEANDGSEGLKKLYENSNVDLIISDILMPIMDGFMFCQACKKEKLFEKIPFVFYTSTYTEKLDEDFALKLGAIQFLRKPIDHDELIFTVNNIFSKSETPVKYVKRTRIKNEDVFKLYSERLINKLEQKSLDLGKEVSERKKAEQLLIHKNEILDLIAVNTPLNKIFDRLLLNYEALHPDYLGAISLLDKDGIHLNLESAPSMPKPYNLAIQSGVISKAAGSCGTAAFTKEPVIVSDISNDKLWVDYKDIAIENNLRSCWSLPIFSKDNDVLGTFAIYSRSINTPTTDEISELKLAVNLVNIAIERSRIVAEIKKKDESYKSLINQASDAIVTYSLDGTIYDFNKAAYDNLGYTKKEFSKFKIQDFSIGEFVKNQDNLNKLLKGEAVIFDRQFKRKDNSIIEVEVSAKLQSNGLILGIARDVTEWQNNLKEIKIAKEFSTSLLKSMREGLVVINLESEIISVNPSFCEMTGFTEKELIGVKRPFPYSPPELRKENDARYKLLTQDKNKVDYENIYMRKNGQRFPVHVLISSIYDENGIKTANFSTVKDITERKKAETDLKLAKEFTDKLVMSMQEGLLIVNLEGEIIMVNHSLCNMLDYSKKELIGLNLPYPFAKTEDLEEMLNIKEKVAIGEAPFFNLEFIKKSGEKFLASFLSGNIKDDKGEVIALFGTIKDISEEVKAREKLKLAKDFTDNLVMSMQEGLIIVDLEGKIIMINNSTCKILGYSKKELIGLNLPYPFAKMEDFEEIAKTNKKVAKGESPTFQFEFIRKNGEKFLASFLTGNIKNDQGDVIALFGTMKDISEEEKAKKVLEENAVKSNQKKEVILALASLVGDDLKDSLSKITELSAKTLNVERVSIWSFNLEKTEVICKDLYVTKTNSHSKDQILRDKDNPNYFKALYKNQTILVSDALKDPITKKFGKDYLVPNNIASLMDVFVNSTDGYYGIICFEHVGASRIWTPDEQEFAISIANIVSLMVQGAERKIAENETALSNEQLTQANKELNTLRNQLEQENVYLRNELDLVFNYEEMIYGSEEFSNVLTEVEKVSPTNATVLLLGESGTGKELLARAIHNTSLRNKKPLIKVNCSAIPRELIESELFGHKKGSFTGAFSDKIGKFELADGGTLFLDEIGELPLDMQPKILRFLQEGEIEVVGGTILKKLNVRVIAATNRNLKEEIEKKQFREDLYFRLNVFPIEVPALRNRKDDIPLLVEHFVDKFNKSYEKDIKFIPDDAMNHLKSYNWPGNIRELENLIERAAILSTTNTLLIPGFETEAQQAKQRINNKDSTLETVQRNHILQVLEQCNWKISGANGASTLLDLKPSTLRDKMVKLQIKRTKN